MALDAALLLPCPLCRELPDDSPLSDVTRWALFGVEQARASGGGSLPAPTSAGAGSLTATATGSLVAASVTGAGVAALLAVGTGAPSAEGATSEAAGVLRCTGDGALSTPSATCAASGTAYAPSVGDAVCVLGSVTSAAVGRCFVGAPTGTVATLTLGTSSATASLADSLGTAALASSVAAADLAASLATLTVAASVATAETAVSYTIVAGDTLPALTATLKVNGTVVNLTGATVALRWSCGGTRGDLAGSVTDATGGVCAFDLSSLPSGSGRGEIVVTFADDETRTFPSAEAFPIVVRAAI
ncbi:MAG: hypothetical protein RIS45_1681 [Planctomycetota bacterium]